MIASLKVSHRLPWWATASIVAGIALVLCFPARGQSAEREQAAPAAPRDALRVAPVDSLVTPELLADWKGLLLPLAPVDGFAADALNGSNQLTLQNIRKAWKVEQVAITDSILPDREIATVKLAEPVQQMKWTRDLTVMASLSSHMKVDGGKRVTLATYRIWDAQTGKLKHSLGELEYSATQNGLQRPPFLMTFGFTPDGKRLAISQRLQQEVGDTVEFYSVENGTLLKAIEMEYGRGRVCFAFSPDESTLAVCGSTASTREEVGMVRLFETATGKLNRTLVSDDLYMTISVAFSSDGKLLAAGSHKEGIAIWDLATDKVRKTLRGDGPVSLSFSPDGKQLVSAGSQTTVWELNSGKSRQLTGSTHDVAFSPNGQFVAGQEVVIKDRKRNYILRVWDARTADLLHEWPAQGSGFAFAPDSKSLATLADENTVKIRAIGK